MVSDVYKYVLDFIKLKPEYITFHIEAVSNPLELINLIKKNNVKVGLAIKPVRAVKFRPVFFSEFHVNK